jgi:hypothetical protein
MKNLVVLIALLIVAAFQANAQTTYSCLELDSNGDPTGYTIDITVEWTTPTDATVTRSSRISTGGDTYRLFNLTDDEFTEDGDQWEISFDQTTYFIPFDSGNEGIIATGHVACYCKGSEAGNDNCRFPHYGSCYNFGTCNRCKTRFWHDATEKVLGVFIPASSVTLISE